MKPAIIIKFQHPPWLRQPRNEASPSNCASSPLAGTCAKPSHPHRDNQRPITSNKYEIAATAMKIWQKVTSGLGSCRKVFPSEYAVEFAGTLNVFIVDAVKRSPICVIALSSVQQISRS